MKKEDKNDQKKASYEKPVLMKFKKLTDVIAQADSELVYMEPHS